MSLKAWFDFSLIKKTTVLKTSSGFHSLFSKILLFLIFTLSTSHSVVAQTQDRKQTGWLLDTIHEKSVVEDANKRLKCAMEQPEFMLKNWVALPTSPNPTTISSHHLSLEDAILLALRYNPNIQNAELDRIIQRYQLRLAHNDFELQYAIGGQALIEQNRFSGVGKSTNRAAFLTPEINYKNPWGGTASLKMDNNVQSEGNYNPLANLNITQPLLRGFGRDVTQAGLKNALDTDFLNQLNLRQSVMDQITQVITTYRTLIISGHNLKNQKRQLQDAKRTFEANEKRIQAGQLEPSGNIQQSYQVESLSLLVEQAENDFRTTAQDLLQAIGLSPEMRLSVPSDVDIQKIVVPNVEDAVELGLKNNTQYQALLMALRADERAYKVARNQQLWELNATANVQTGLLSNVDKVTPGGDNIYQGRNITESLGVTLNIPINDLNRREQLISAKIRLEKDRINIIAAKRALVTSIKNTVTNIQSQARRYELAQRQLKLAQKSYQLEQKKQAAGISNVLDVHNTQNQLLQAQVSLINSKIDYLNQLSSLHKLIGTTLEHWGIKLRYC
tara:strand:+ start:4033 stop:5709 length:1677 start_codon:yes stop_codon:yes gene_type:complete